MFQFLTIKQLWLVVCHLSRQRLDTAVASLPIPFFCATSNGSQVKTIASFLFKLDLLPSASYITSQKSAKHFEFVNTHFLPFLMYPLPHHEPDESGLLAWTGTGTVPVWLVKTQCVPESIKLFFFSTMIKGRLINDSGIILL